MKLRFTALALTFSLICSLAHARKSDLYESKYFIFQNNQQLNAHLFLYNKAIACKFGKINNDSLAYHALKDQWQHFTTTDKVLLNNVLLFYKDSVLTKDLLFDSLMRNFEDYLASENTKQKLKNAWQRSTLEVMNVFQPYFKNWYWSGIDSTNKAWLNANKSQITAMENEVVRELERIYKTKLPEGKIRVDLTCYATWAGAYSYNDDFCHIVFSSVSKANQGDLAAEVIFHETSHFLVDKLIMQINTLAKNKKLERELGLWHDVIFYTTGFVLEKHYKLKWQKFEPYYVQMKFQEKFPPFKNSVEGCKLYWDPYLSGQVGFDQALNNLVNYVVEKNNSR